MYRVAVIDDDKEQVDIIVRMIADHPKNALFKIEHGSGIADLEKLAKNRLDILFMDIDFGTSNENGIQAVRTIVGKRTQVVFVTGYAEYHSRVYDADHTGFLLKPIDQDELEHSIDRALDRLDNPIFHPIVVRANGQVRSILPDEIMYIESMRRKVRIHLEDETLETYGALSSYPEKLPGFFIQCHKSFLVNVSYIGNMEKDHVIMRSGDKVPVSQSRRKMTREAFWSILESEA